VKVKKRDGRLEDVSFNKITKRLSELITLKNTDFPKLLVDPMVVSQKVIAGLYDGVSTRELDELAAQVSNSLVTTNIDFGTLAARIEVSSLHKETLTSFLEKCQILLGSKAISESFFKEVEKNYLKIEEKIDYNRDYLFSYFGLKTLKKSYLLKDYSGEIIERPQDLIMRVSLFIHQDNLEKAFETYDLISNHYFTHATPTLFNAGTSKPQLSSCFLIDIDSDSIKGIYKTLSDCADISQSAGGIGLAIHKIRSSGSFISGTNGVSNGIVPMLRVFDATARYVDQCFEGDTIVYTNEGPKEISKIVRGDKVLTEDGSYKEVINHIIHDKEERDGFSVRVKKSIRAKNVTDSHPFLSITGQKIGLNKNVIKNRLEKGISSPEYRKISSLNIGDYVGFPLSKEVKDNDSFSIEDCYLYGLLLGDGHVTESGAFTVYLGHHESRQINFVKKYCDDNGIEYHVEMIESHIRIRTNNPKVVKFSREMLYDESKEKRFHKSMQMLPFEKSMSIVFGLMDSDGHYGDKEYLLEMSSKQVIESTRAVLMRFGILTSGYDRNRIGNKSSYKDIETKKETITLRIPKSSLFSKFIGVDSGEYDMSFIHNNISWCRITEKTPVKLNSILYDLEVDGNENYVTELGIVHNGGNKRKGSFAIYIEPWHSDIFDFLELKKNHGKEESRARDLFYGLWIPDLFMERVESDGDWTLFDPKEHADLINLVGERFSSRFSEYEKAGKGKKIKARDLWDRIIASQIETGTPYMLYKDAANVKSNQKNLGTIKSSNLCTEIIEYTSPEEIAVCNLASICLSKFATKDCSDVDYDALYRISRTVTNNLNKVIDVNYYPVEEARVSNTKHRPIGIGVQGLADLFAKLRIPFTSQRAREINKRVFEVIYKGAIDESISLAKTEGTYESYNGSPASNGQLQFDLWGLSRDNLFMDWTSTFEALRLYGLRNSLLLAPMPTASTAQIFGNNEAFEPFTSNIYVRRVLSGEFIVVNEHLMKELNAKGLWSDEFKNDLIKGDGSIQAVNIAKYYNKDKHGSPNEFLNWWNEVKDIYKTVWELKMKDIIDMSADRGAFICQSQSLNLFIEEPSEAKISSMHFYGWKKGLKTGMYYLRTRPATNAIKFTVTDSKESEVTMEEIVACSLDDPDSCIMCSG
jgi:ribonucleoside-diphosphate reductase alpha subunit